MSVYRCEQCGCLENTSLGAFWGNEIDNKVLCSECAYGTWHGMFDKKTPEEWNVSEDQLINGDHVSY